MLLHNMVKLWNDIDFIRNLLKLKCISVRCCIVQRYNEHAYTGISELWFFHPKKAKYFFLVYCRFLIRPDQTLCRNTFYLLRRCSATFGPNEINSFPQFNYRKQMMHICFLATF